MQAFSGKPPREKPQNAAAELKVARNFYISEIENEFRERGNRALVIVSAAPHQSAICVKFSVFQTVFDVKFW